MNNLQTVTLPIKGGLNTKGINKKGDADLPLVTIITSVWNGGESLEFAIESVLNQTYPNVEYIIIDGGSTDNTIDIIKKYEDRIDYWVSEKDRGIYDAWNKGIAAANGEWIGFIGADDICFPNAIKSMIEVVINPGNRLDYVSGRGEITLNGVVKRVDGEPWVWNKFRHYVCTAQAGALHSKLLYTEVGLYDESFKIVGDYELLLRKGVELKAGFTSSVTVSFALGGISNNNFNVVFETYKAQMKHSKLNRIIVIFNFLKNGSAFFFKTFLNIF